MNHRQLTFAREFRGYSQSELSSSITGLSQSNLSKFEKGIGYLSESVQNEIINFLNFPKDFFDKKIFNVIDNANYRKKSTVSKSHVNDFEFRCKLVGYIIDEMSEDINWPEFKFRPLNVEDGFEPEYIAMYTRKKCKIDPFKPVRDIFTVIENNGVIIYEIDALEKFDGVSFHTDKGYPVIIINKNFSNDRKRFTLAHELGHLLMHNESEFPISSYRDKEKEANLFASEFLMPENAIKNSLFRLKFRDLLEFKQYWLTSMASIVRRAADLNCISSIEYKNFYIQLSRAGYTKREPGHVFIDQPSVFSEGIKLLRDDLKYTLDELVNYLSLPEDVIDELLSVENEQKLKLLF